MKYALRDFKINFGADHGSNSVVDGKKNELHGELEIGNLEIEYNEKEFKQVIKTIREVLNVVKDLSRS